MTVVGIARTRHPASTRRPVVLGLSGSIAASFLGLMLLLALLAPVILSQDPNQNDYDALFAGPSTGHPLGTDHLGRDLLTRLIYGGRVSLLGVGQALIVYLALGLVVGVVAGYVRGWFDTLVGWLADLSFAVPQIIVILAVLAIFSNSGTAAMVVLGLLGAPGLAVMASGATRADRSEKFIAAAQVSGLSDLQIIRRHVLPRIAGAVIVQAALFAGTALVFQTGLDFLGIGTQPPTASWGAMVAEGSRYINRDPWMIVPSGVIIGLSIIALGVLGDAVRDARGPRRGAPPRALRPTFAPPDARVEERNLTPASSDAVLSVRNVTVEARVGDGFQPIVENVSFDLSAGECLGVVGESGCGKSMTALAVLGLLPVGTRLTSGSVTLQGEEIVGLPDKKLARLRGSSISLISQEPIASLDPSFTVGSQVAEVIRRHLGGSRRQARNAALHLLDRVRLPEPERVARKYPHELSGGMAQRVGIALALAGRPSVIVADEPTTALDVTVQLEILNLLRSLREEEGVAMVLVSHDWGVIADSCDRAMVMYAGQVVEQAATLAVFADTRHPYSVALMGANPHHSIAPRSRLQALSGSVPRIGEWPNHCRFADRCGRVTADCLEGPVPLHDADGDHPVRCLHPYDRSVTAGRQAGSTHVS